MGRMSVKLACIVLLAASLLSPMAPGRADAAFTIAISQVGNNVVATGTGSLNVTGLSNRLTSIFGASIRPVFGSLTIGITDFRRSYDAYFSTNTGFGADVTRETSTGTGYHVGILAQANLLFLSDIYVSGTQFTSTATFFGTTIAGLGLTLGTYTYAYSATRGGPALDTVTIQVGPGAGTVPEPSSGLLCVIAGLVGVASRPFRRHRAR